MMPRHRTLCAALLALALLAAPAGAGAGGGDPLDSPMWDWLADIYFPGPVVFDDRVKVVAPEAAEDVFNVPVMIDATALEGVEEIVALADLNPIPRILSYRPGAAKALIGFRFKVQQATPVRAAVRTADGVWHVGGTRVDASGGGCTAPALAHADKGWESRLGELHARTWTDGDALRLRLRLRHPMDTGLAEGIPAFYLEELTVTAADGTVLGTVVPYEPVSENPLFTLALDGARAAGGPLRVDGRDNNGNSFQGSVPVRAELLP